jgi:hypothetical protein
MDLVSHGLWGSVVARRKSIYLGFLSGVLPDILGMGWHFGPRPYLIAHSLIGIIVIALISRTIFHTWIYGGSYSLHVFIDVFAHNRGTRPLFYVPFLWQSYDPIGFHGWNWWHEGSILEIINWILLVFVLTVIYISKYRKISSKNIKQE